jgi:hypothetical protein
MFHDLLDSYDEIKLSDSKEHCSMAEIERYLVRVIIQFNSTVAILTGIDYPFVTLPKKLIFGQDPFIQRLQYGIQYGEYLLLTNLYSGWSIDLFKHILFTIFRPEEIVLRFYDLFISSPDLIKSLGEGGSANKHQRESWVRVYNNTLNSWKFSVVPQARH